MYIYLFDGTFIYFMGHSELFISCCIYLFNFVAFASSISGWFRNQGGAAHFLWHLDGIRSKLFTWIRVYFVFTVKLWLNLLTFTKFTCMLLNMDEMKWDTWSIMGDRRSWMINPDQHVQLLQSGTGSVWSFTADAPYFSCVSSSLAVLFLLKLCVFSISCAFSPLAMCCLH